jgi:hypothetical protein
LDNPRSGNHVVSHILRCCKLGISRLKIGQCKFFEGNKIEKFFMFLKIYPKFPSTQKIYTIKFYIRKFCFFFTQKLNFQKVNKNLSVLCPLFIFPVSIKLNLQRASKNTYRMIIINLRLANKKRADVNGDKKCGILRLFAFCL